MTVDMDFNSTIHMTQYDRNVKTGHMELALRPAVKEWCRDNLITCPVLWMRLPMEVILTFQSKDDEILFYLNYCDNFI